MVKRPAAITHANDAVPAVSHVVGMSFEHCMVASHWNDFCDSMQSSFPVDLDGTRRKPTCCHVVQQQVDYWGKDGEELHYATFEIISGHYTLL